MGLNRREFLATAALAAPAAFAGGCVAEAVDGTKPVPPGPLKVCVFAYRMPDGRWKRHPKIFLKYPLAHMGENMISYARLDRGRVSDTVSDTLIPRKGQG